jgi:hypothetical protein
VRDRSELAIFEERGGHFVCRALRTFENVPFDDQEGAVRRMLDVLPITRLSIDSGGLGMHLAENLQRDFPDVVVLEKFTAETKQRWAIDLKLLMQRRHVELPRDRELIRQFHSLERRTSSAANVIIDAPAGRRGHADRFWAVALACQRDRAALVVAPKPAVVTVTIVGAGPQEHRPIDIADMFPDGVIEDGMLRKGKRWLKPGEPELQPLPEPKRLEPGRAGAMADPSRDADGARAPLPPASPNAHKTVTQMTDESNLAAMRAHEATLIDPGAKKHYAGLREAYEARLAAEARRRAAWIASQAAEQAHLDATREQRRKQRAEQARINEEMREANRRAAEEEDRRMGFYR